LAPVDGVTQFTSTRRAPFANFAGLTFPNPGPVVSPEVTLCDAADDEVRHRLVGADEIDPEKSWISIDSPMAKALLGHTLDDEIVVKTPTGPMSYWVVSVRYQ